MLFPLGMASAPDKMDEVSKGGSSEDSADNLLSAIILWNIAVFSIHILVGP
jgi:hypothetical protein